MYDHYLTEVFVQGVCPSHVREQATKKLIFIIIIQLWLLAKSQGKQPSATTEDTDV